MPYGADRAVHIGDLVRLSAFAIRLGLRFVQVRLHRASFRFFLLNGIAPDTLVRVPAASAGPERLRSAAAQMTKSVFILLG